jgi:hypothetical protein
VPLIVAFSLAAFAEAGIATNDPTVTAVMTGIIRRFTFSPQLYIDNYFIYIKVRCITIAITYPTKK